MAIDYSTLGTGSTSWNDLIVTVIPRGASPIEDIDVTALAWSVSRSRGVQPKRGRKFGRSRGSTEYSASMSLYVSGWKALRASMLSAASDLDRKLMDVEFDVVAKRKPLDSDTVETVRIERCCFDEVGEDFSEGDDPDQVSLTLNPMSVTMIVDGEEVAVE